MACLDQQHSGREGQVVVVVEDLPISDLDDSSNLDCICCLKGHNYFAIVGFAAEGVYYKCLQHKLQVAAKKDIDLYGDLLRNIDPRLLQQVQIQISNSWQAELLV